MPSSQGPRRRRLPSWAAGALALTAAVGAAISGAGPAQAAPSTGAGPATGTATAVAGQVDLDAKLLPGLLDALHLGLPDGLDVPLANLSLGAASAPNANGDSANFTNSVLRLRDDLIDRLHLPGPEADLLKADVVSGTARVINGPGGYTQAYATVANLRLFLPLLNLPGASADNGILKVDAVSAQATCQPGQKPSASAKMPTTIVLLGRQIPVPLTGEVPLDVPGVAKIDLHLAPVSTTDGRGASAAVEARITVDAAGLAEVSGGIVLAKAACTLPAAAAGSSTAGGTTTGGAATGGTTGGTTAGTTAGTTGGATATGGTTGSVAATATASAPAKTGDKTGDKAAAGNGDHALAETGASGSLLPIAGVAAVLVLGGAGLLVYLRKKAAGTATPPPSSDE